MNRRRSSTWPLIFLGVLLATWPGLLAALGSSCLASSDWCPDGGTAPENSASPDAGSQTPRSEPGNPPPCPPP